MVLSTNVSFRKQNARLVIKNIPAVPVGVHDSMSLLISKFSGSYFVAAFIKIIIL